MDGLEVGAFGGILQLDVVQLRGCLRNLLLESAQLLNSFMDSVIGAQLG